MAGRRPVRIDGGEYTKYIRDIGSLYPYELTTGVRGIFLGWWADRKSHHSGVHPGIGRSLLISEPEGAEDDIAVAAQGWRILGGRGFEVAAETGHRIADVACSLGHTGVYGVAAGSIDVATLVVASHATSNPGEIDALLPHLVDQTNKQLERDAIPLRLPLVDMLSR